VTATTTAETTRMKSTVDTVFKCHLFDCHCHLIRFTADRLWKVLTVHVQSNETIYAIGRSFHACQPTATKFCIQDKAQWITFWTWSARSISRAKSTNYQHVTRSMTARVRTIFVAKGADFEDSCGCAASTFLLSLPILSPPLSSFLSPPLPLFFFIPTPPFSYI